MAVRGNNSGRVIVNPSQPGEFKELVAMDVSFREGGSALTVTFSKADVARLRKHTPPLPSEPTVLNVDVGHYQRDLSMGHVERLRLNWDEAAHEEPSLSIRPDGSVYIINGQHVIVAAFYEGERELLAWVYWGLSIPGEAAKRRKKNAGRRDTALEDFHARLTEEWESPGTATAIVGLLSKFDTRVNASNNKNVGVNCVGTLIRIYDVDAGVTLRRGLKLIYDAFGAIKGEAARAALIEAAARFMTVHRGELRYQYLVERLKRRGPDGLLDLARHHKRIMGGPDSINTYRAMVQVYNEKLRKEEYRLEANTSRYTVEVPGAIHGFDAAV